ncbi:MAG: PilZ domain-containing protein [Candidatus Omnitrophica bacterium]|nr:PilZ domain-containing protein [Candidatus Omnitrophota bacterium]
MEDDIAKIENRRHPRVHQAFFVDFQLLDESGQPYGSVYRAITRNVAKGGLSIQCELDREKDRLELIPYKSKLKVSIRIPHDAPPVDSVVTVKWMTKVSEPAFDVYFFGVEYEKIDNIQQKMIERHIKRVRKSPRIFVYFFLLFTALTIVFTYILLIAR